MRRILLLGAVVGLGAAGGAGADLYRWVDPESGSVKFSSYPPPWFGKPELERRAPKVEHIPARGSAPAAPAEEAKEASRQAIATQETQRQDLVKQIASQFALPPDQSGPALGRLFENLGGLIKELNRLDPKGASARQAEVKSLSERRPPEAAR